MKAIPLTIPDTDRTSSPDVKGMQCLDNRSSGVEVTLEDNYQFYCQRIAPYQIFKRSPSPILTSAVPKKFESISVYFTAVNKTVFRSFKLDFARLVCNIVPKANCKYDVGVSRLWQVTGPSDKSWIVPSLILGIDINRNLFVEINKAQKKIYEFISSIKQGIFPEYSADRLELGEKIAQKVQTKHKTQKEIDLWAEQLSNDVANSTD